MTFSALQKKWLTGAFGRRVKFEEPMKRHTSFKVGGAAEAFVIPASFSELVCLLAFSQENALPCMVIGSGTNLLVKDEGIRGLVIAMTKELGTMEREVNDNDEVFVNAMAGASLGMLCRFAVDSGLAGINFATGIPGTVGGAIRMNAGTASGAMGDILTEVTVMLPNGNVQRIAKEDLHLCYRGIVWPEEYNDRHFPFQPIILGGRFRLHSGDPELIKAEAKSLWSDRKRKQPTNLPSAGCFFRNPDDGMPAGMLIEKAGLKGRQAGGAQVSPKHANFIVNTGSASATDILKLMEIVQHTVFEEFNIRLEPEVKIVG